MKKGSTAYIISILHSKERGRILRSMSEKELQKLSDSENEHNSFTIKEKISLLNAFISSYKKWIFREKRIINISYTVSFFLLSLIIGASFFSATLSGRTPDQIIRYMENILMSGGVHLALTPIAIGYLFIDINSKNLFKNFSPLDIPIGIIAGFILAYIMISLTGAASGAIDPFLLIMSVSAVPFTEEVFFRYFLFFKPGKKKGYLIMGLFSSLLFSVVHLPGNFEYFLSFTLIALLQTALIYSRRNIVIVIVSHGIANLLIQLL